MSGYTPGVSPRKTAGGLISKNAYLPPEASASLAALAIVLQRSESHLLAEGWDILRQRLESGLTREERALYDALLSRK